MKRMRTVERIGVGRPSLTAEECLRGQGSTHYEYNDRGRPLLSVFGGMTKGQAVRQLFSNGPLALLYLLTGCNTGQSTLDVDGPGAGTIAGVSWFIFLLFVGVTIVMGILLLWAALRRQGTFEEHAPYDTGGGHLWILIGGFLVPTILLAVVFVVGLRAMETFPLHDGGPRAPEVRVIGHQWWWEVHYLDDSPHRQIVTANEIHIPTGRPVEFELESADVIHSFWVPKLHGKVDLVPGLRNRVRLQADQPGIYHGECAEFCGVQHAHMRLLLVAEPPEKFAQWVEQQRTPGTTPDLPEAIRGQTLFVSRACGLCHTVRGTEALGGVAPDLTHIASRRRIAANSLPNNTAYLAAWVTHAQSFKPGAQMPNITQFTGEELRALVAYLEQLR